MKFTLTLILQFIVLLLIAQTEVPRVTHLVDIDLHPIKGFTIIDNIEYLIERGKYTTKISEVRSDGLELIHEVSYRPSDDNPKYYNSNFKDNNSGVVVNDGLLFEFYQSSIYVTNILTGELVHGIELEDEKILIYGDFFILGDKYYFKGRYEGKNPNGYFYYDLLTSELHKVDFTTTNDFYRRGHKLLDWNSDKTKLMSFDLISGDTTELVSSINPFRNQRSTTKDGVNHIFFFDEFDNGFHMNGLGEVNPLPCSIEDITNINQMYVSDHYLLINYGNVTNTDSSSAILIDLNTCTEVLSISKSENHQLGISDIKNLNDEFIIMHDINYSDSLNNVIIIDLETEAVTKIPTNFNARFSLSSVRNDNNLYLIASKHNWSFYLPPFYFIAKIGLKTNTLEVLEEGAEDYNSTFVLGEDRADDMINYYSNNDGKIKSIDINDVIKEKVDLNRNIDLGIEHIKNIFRYNDKVYCWINDGVYVMKDHTISKLLAADGMTKIIEYNGFIYAMIKQDTSVYLLKIDGQEDSYKTISTDLSYDDFNRILVSGYIFVNSDKNKSDNYFDVRTEQNEDFLFNDDKLDWYRNRISGSTVLLKNMVQNENYYLYDGIQNNTIEVTNIDLYRSLFFADTKGSFFAMESNHNSPNNVYKLRSDGEVEFITEVNGKFCSRSRNWLEGKYSTIAISNQDSVMFVMDNQEEHILRSVPYPHVRPNTHIKWKEIDGHVIVETEIQELYHTYYFSMDNQAIDLTPDGKNDRLQQVVFGSNKILLSYFDKKTSMMEFKTLDKSTLEFKTVLVKAASKYNYYTNFYKSESLKISDGKYLLNFDDGVVGQELWVYDYDQNTLVLLKDINENYTGSSASNFLSINDEVYFTAETPDRSRQWFFIDENGLGVKPIVTNIKTLKIFPCPAISEIVFDVELTRFHVVDCLGRKIDSREDLSGSIKLNISNYSQGIYYLWGYDNEGNKFIGEFVKY